MALAKHLLVAACAGFCITPCLAGDAAQKSVSQVETAKQRSLCETLGTNAYALFVNGHVPEAQRFIDRAIMQNPHSGALYAWRARIYLEILFDTSTKLNRDALARSMKSDVARAQALEPKLSNVFYVRGRMALVEPDEDKALAEMNRAIEYDSKNVKARIWRAQMLEGNRDVVNALKDSDVAVKLEPNLDTLTRRGVIRRHAGDYKGSIEDYTRALGITKAHFIYVKRGEVYEDAKQYDNAIADYRQALAIYLDKVNVVSVRKKVARLLMNTGKYELAAKEYEDVVKLNPEDVAVMGQVATCYTKMKNWNGALKYVNKLLEFESQYEGYYRQRAEIYRAMGKKDLAAADDLKAKELHKQGEAPLR